MISPVCPYPLVVPWLNEVSENEVSMTSVISSVAGSAIYVMFGSRDKIP